MNDNLRDEQMFAYKVAHRLDQGADQLNAITLNNLMVARQRALARQKVAVGQLSMAGVGHAVHDLLMPQMRMLFALLFLAVGVIGSYYWHNFQQADENEEIDSALLADDIPLNAYLDHGFHAWLDQPARSDQPSQE